VVAGILMIGILGLMIDTLFRRVERFAIERR
jgi:ABC-type nitrate/sulfonate/bicarbonate transport system permease component